MSSFFSLFCFRGLISWQRTRSITTVNTRIMRNEVSLFSCFLNSYILFHSFISEFLCFLLLLFKAAQAEKKKAPLMKKANGLLGSENNFLFIFMKIATQSEKKREKIKNTNTTSLILLM